MDALAVAKSKTIIALDSTLEQATPTIRSLEKVGPYRAKVGPRMINAGEVPGLVSLTGKHDGTVFFHDGKEYDTWPAMQQAVESILAHNIPMFNIAAAAGIRAMIEVRKMVEKVALKANLSTRPMIIAVTVPTTMEEEEAFLTYGKPVKAAVLQFAQWAKLAGLDGIVCSPQELEYLRKHEELDGLRYCTPGIRLPGSDPGAQRRFTTAAEAVKAGADWIVVGTPITKPDGGLSPAEAYMRIIEEVAGAL